MLQESIPDDDDDDHRIIRIYSINLYQNIKFDPVNQTASLHKCFKNVQVNMCKQGQETADIIMILLLFLFLFCLFVRWSEYVFKRVGWYGTVLIRGIMAFPHFTVQARRTRKHFQNKRYSHFSSLNAYVVPPGKFEHLGKKKTKQEENNQGGEILGSRTFHSIRFKKPAICLFPFVSLFGQNPNGCWGWKVSFAFLWLRRGVQGCVVCIENPRSLWSLDSVGPRRCGSEWC